MISTTLSAIRSASPCREGWEKLLASLGGVGAYLLGTPLPAVKVLESNGIDDALWVLANACGDEGKRLCVVFACDVAERVLAVYEKHYPSDNRPRKAIEAARAYADNPTDAASAAYAADAAADAAYAAYAAADAAADAADAASAASAAAYAAYAADAAADAAAYAAADAAADAADAAYAAYAAAYAAEKEWQLSRLRELLSAE